MATLPESAPGLWVTGCLIPPVDIYSASAHAWHLPGPWGWAGGTDSGGGGSLSLGRRFSGRNDEQRSGEGDLEGGCVAGKERQDHGLMWEPLSGVPVPAASPSPCPARPSTSRPLVSRLSGPRLLDQGHLPASLSTPLPLGSCLCLFGAPSPGRPAQTPAGLSCGSLSEQSHLGGHHLCDPPGHSPPAPGPQACCVSSGLNCAPLGSLLQHPSLELARTALQARSLSGPLNLRCRSDTALVI